MRKLVGFALYCIAGATAIQVFWPLARHGTFTFYEYNHALAWAEFGICVFCAGLGLVSVIRERRER